MRYNEHYPRHAHRIPSEIAEDESVYCIAEERSTQAITVPTSDPTFKCTEIPRARALLSWADAHPLKPLT